MYKFMTVIFFMLISSQSFALTDKEMANTIYSSIRANKNTSASKILVRVNNGMVYLSGTLASEQEASSAIEIASSIVGAEHVNSDKLLLVNAKTPNTDAHITAKVKGALIKDKTFGEKPDDMKGITVNTQKGVVHVTAPTITQDQEKAATGISKNIQGVHGVQFNILLKH